MKSLKDIINETILSRKLSDPKRTLLEEWLDEYEIENYSINSKGEIDVNGDVDLRNSDIKELPEYIQFGTVKGDFRCSFNELTSLRGCPRVVGGSFDCDFNELTTLEGAPKICKGMFDCSHNKLTTLKGAPQKVGKSFDCRWNNLTSLEGAPKEVRGIFYYNHNTTEFSIEDVEKVCKI